jgi:hypothetical protein
MIRVFTVEEVRARNRPPYPLVPLLEHVFERALTGRDPFKVCPNSFCGHMNSGKQAGA